jgi:hypothetical protein
VTKSIFHTQPEESDIFLYFGTCMLFSGFFLVYPPLGYIVAGAVCMVIAYAAAKSPAPPVTVGGN